MSPKELRIGNYFEYSGYICIAESINGFDGFVQYKLIKCEENNGVYRVPIELVKPIPITQQWFLKFGFNAYGGKDTFYDIDENFPMLENEENGEGYYCSDLNITIKNVHQLQNLYFSLTGKELTIENNE